MTTQNSMNTINSKIDKIIIVDPGKNTVNALCFDSNFNLIGHVAFPSVTQRKRSFRDIDSSSDLQFQVEYQDEKFLVGEGILTGFNFETSKNTMHHKICIDTAIAYFVDNNNFPVAFTISGFTSRCLPNTLLINRKFLFELLTLFPTEIKS